MKGRCSRRIWILGTITALGAACAPPRQPVPVPAGAPRRGPADAKLVLQEIGDYECPFCADVQPAVERLMQTYGSDVALAWRNYPLRAHPHAALAAESALEVKAQLGDDGFWKYHATLLRNQTALEARDLERHAQSIGGVDLSRFVRALTDRIHRRAVEDDRRAIDQLRIERMATPAFLLVGDVLVGAYPYEALAQWVDDRV